MGKKQRRCIADALSSVPEHEPRVILATGKLHRRRLRRCALGYLGEDGSLRSSGLLRSRLSQHLGLQIWDYKWLAAENNQ
jgi:hypothetical protein